MLSIFSNMKRVGSNARAFPEKRARMHATSTSATKVEKYQNVHINFLGRILNGLNGQRTQGAK